MHVRVNRVVINLLIFSKLCAQAIKIFPHCSIIQRDSQPWSLEEGKKVIIKADINFGGRDKKLGIGFNLYRRLRCRVCDGGGC